MKRKLTISKHNLDFDVDVEYSISVEEEKIVLKTEFNNQKRTFDYPLSKYKEDLFDQFDSIDEIAENIFDDNIEDLKNNIAYFFEPEKYIELNPEL